MSFYDKKEEVIEISLTSYGKNLLSKGLFKPYYFSFSDDELIYDNSYCEVDEQQNDIQDRIKDGPYLKWKEGRGIETSLINKNEYTGSVEVCLGTSEIGNQYFPAWNVVRLNNDMSCSFEVSINSKSPQIFLNSKYKTFVDFTEQPNPSEEFEPRLNNVGIEKVYSDGSHIEIEENYVLLEINEENVPFSKENFDIEVYYKKNVSFSKTSGNLTELVPLYFIDIKDEETVEQKILNIELLNGIENVEYFLTLQCDEEIDFEILCKYIKNQKVKNTLSDKMIAICKENKDTQINAYEVQEVIDEDCE